MTAKITPEDMADLPPELVKQLVDKELCHDHHDTTKLVTLVRAAAEPLNINQLLIGMYRTYGKILKRRNMIGLMHYAVTRGYVTKIDSGVYGPAGMKRP